MTEHNIISVENQTSSSASVVLSRILAA